jgi:hypothetical protein
MKKRVARKSPAKDPRWLARNALWDAFWLVNDVFPE